MAHGLLPITYCRKAVRFLDTNQIGLLYIYELKEAAQLYFVLPLFVFINRNFTYKDIRVFHGRCFTIMYWHGRLVIPALQRFCASQQVAREATFPSIG